MLPLKALLSEKHLEITRAIVAGQTNAQIACARGTSEQTIKNCVGAILEQARCKSRLQLALRYARENFDELRAKEPTVSETWVFGGR